MGYGDKPYGMRQLLVTNMAGDTQAALPSAMKLGFKERIQTNEMRGDDQLVALVSVTDALEWSLEAGGISLEVWAMLTGHTQVEAGVTPAQTNTYTIAGGQCYPYFKVYGKAVGENCSDDIHILLFKCKLTEPLEGEFADGEFFVTKCAGLAIDDGVNGIADLVQNETAATLPAT